MKIFFADHFKRQVKRLKKKYPQVKEDLLGELERFEVGDGSWLADSKLQNIVHVGSSIYKLRVGSSNMAKGKSGGFRSYVFFYRRQEMLVPLCIYAKSDTESISSGELQFHFDSICRELWGCET